MNNLWRLMLIFILTGAGPQSLAYGQNETTQMLETQNFTDSVLLFSDFLHTASLVLGLSFALAGVIKYLAYRSSPSSTNPGTIFFMFLCGVIFIILSLATSFQESN